MFHEVWGQFDYPSGLGRIQFKFWHWMFTYWAITLYQGLFSPQNTWVLFFMMRNCLTCWKRDLVELGSPPFLTPFCQRGLSDPQNGGIFQMFPECACPHWLQLDLVPIGSIAVEVYCSQWGHLCLLGRGVKPIFRHPCAGSDQPLHQIKSLKLYLTWFYK